jgi:hypothetical protein
MSLIDAHPRASTSWPGWHRLKSVICSGLFVLFTVYLQEVNIVEQVLGLVEQLMALGGFAAFVAILINVLKTFGVVKDGTSGTWAAGLNLAGLIALFALNIVEPGFDVGGVDAHLAQIAQILTLIFNYIMQNWVSKGTHQVLSSGGVPVIGRSYTQNTE